MNSKATSPGHPTVFSALWLLPFLLLVFACWTSVRFAVADFFFGVNTPQSLEKAVGLVPGNAAYHALLAEHIEGLGANPDSQLLEATRLSPADSSNWIRLGFRAEVEGDYPKAEQYLLHAAQIDHKFDPRWALASFYFRVNNSDKFWEWIGKSLLMAYGDMSPIFKLMWSVTSDEQTIRAHIPDRPETQDAYLWFLTANHPEAGAPVAARIAAHASADELPLLLQYSDRVLETDTSSALRIWNALCVRRLLPGLALDPGSGNVITNGSFTAPPIQRVFDWHIPSLDGVTSSPSSDPPGYTIDLSGNQPEDCTLLYQMIPVQSGARYNLTYEYRSPSVGSMRGLTWEAGSGTSPELAPAADWKDDSFAFNSGAASVLRLALGYRRTPGTTRSEGVLNIRNIAARRDQ